MDPIKLSILTFNYAGALLVGQRAKPQVGRRGRRPGRGRARSSIEARTLSTILARSTVWHNKMGH